MKVAANGIDINVSVSINVSAGEQRGAKPALVFLHYWGGSSRTWDQVIAALPSRYPTVAPDLRGWGDSDRPADGYALDDFAEDTLQMLAALDVREYVLVGHSMGGKIAQLLASRRPAGLKGLVLVAPSPPVPLSMPSEARSAMESAYDTRESVGMAIDHMLTAKQLSATVREQIIEDSLRGARQARQAWPLRTSREDISRAVTDIAVPTVVIAGELDKVDPVAVLEAEVMTRIAQAVLHILPGSGHLSPLESPLEVAALIARFADALPRRADLI
jgi:pimeloyl-ACP methyl ester carboxylesterase